MEKQTSDNTEQKGKHPHGRFSALLVALLLVVAGGGLIAWMTDFYVTTPADSTADRLIEKPLQPNQPTAKQQLPAITEIDKSILGDHQDKQSREIHQRFQQSVVMLHAKEFENAAAAIHRVLELAPEMPEAHVNMGFALLGLEQYEAAKDFFNTALNLRGTQVNALYGLAVAYEQLGDLESALGAMRSYIHLIDENNPYRRKAMAAVWEWETKLQNGRTDSPGDTAGESGNEAGS